MSTVSSSCCLRSLASVGSVAAIRSATAPGASVFPTTLISSSGSPGVSVTTFSNSERTLRVSASSSRSASGAGSSMASTRARR